MTLPEILRPRPVVREGSLRSDLFPVRPQGRARKPSPGKVFALLVAVLVLVGLPAAAATRYPGEPFPFILFELSFAGMLLLAVPRPRSYVYAFFAAVLFLGFWSKFNVHTLVQYDYQEPIGAFDGARGSWDTALRLAAFAALGVSLARVAHLLIARHWRLSPLSRSNRAGSVPAWFSGHRRKVWVVTAVLLGVVALGNGLLAIYHIGVEDRVVLPLHGNVVVAWLIKFGLAFWIAALVYWEEHLPTARSSPFLAAPIAEAVVGSASSISRGIYLFHVLPYIVVILGNVGRYSRSLGARRLTILAVAAAVGFLLSILTVSGLRLIEYPDGLREGLALQATLAPVPVGAAGTVITHHASAAGDRVSRAFDEVTSLFIERWTGMEAVMAVSAHDDLGRQTFLDALREDPGAGEEGLFQRVARAEEIYIPRTDYTFLTLPGAPALLSFTGSLPVVLLGMAALTVFMLGIETVFGLWNGNPYLLSLAGLAMALEVSQVYSPYLLGAFFVLVIGSLTALTVIGRGGASRPAPLPPAPRQAAP